MKVTKSGGLGETISQAFHGKKKSGPRIMVFQGSARNDESCPDEWGKTRMFIQHAISDLPDGVEIDYCDLSVKGDGEVVQPCKGCISTAGGFHCHWVCSCFQKGSKDSPDTLHNNDVYDRLQSCDAFLVYTPVNWFAPSTQVKAMFDRLVCASLSLTKEQAEELFGGDIKNSELTKKAERSGKYHHLLKNHLKGKVAGFFCHGDGGAADYRELAKDEDRRRTTTPLPAEYKKYMSDEHYEEIDSPRHAVMPLVWACRYMEIDAPDELVYGVRVGAGHDYADGNDLARNSEKAKAAARELMTKTIGYVTSSRA